MSKDGLKNKLMKLIDDINTMSALQNLIYSLLAIAFALVIGGIMIQLSGNSMFEAYRALYDGAFGSSYNFAQTLQKTVPLIFTGLAVAAGFQAGLFNIGAEGQLYWGALATALVAIYLGGLPGVLLIPVSLLVGALAGGVWGVIPGYLKAKTGAHEVITTIMLNYIAVLATTFLLKNFFKADGPVDQTVKVPEAARLGELIAHTQLTWAIFIGLLFVFFLHYLLGNTSLGYDMQAVGKNTSAAEYAGISPDKIVIFSLGLSGFVAGLAGSTMVLGVLHRFITNFSANYGFTGIAVAVLGRNRPTGVLLAALLFGILEAGGMAMQMYTGVPADLMTAVKGMVILFVAAPALVQVVSRLLPGKKKAVSADE